jgi:hypothetical protein
MPTWQNFGGGMPFVGQSCLDAQALLANWWESNGGGWLLQYNLQAISAFMSGPQRK